MYGSEKVNQTRGRDALVENRGIVRLASHACVSGSNPFDPTWVLRRNILVFSFAM